MKDFIREVPKSDLHVHLDGSLRISTLIDMSDSGKVFHLTGSTKDREDIASDIANLPTPSKLGLAVVRLAADRMDKSSMRAKIVAADDAIAWASDATNVEDVVAEAERQADLAARLTIGVADIGDSLTTAIVLDLLTGRLESRSGMVARCGVALGVYRH